MSGVKINSKNLGRFEFSSKTLFKPAPRDTPINIWGNIPIKDPKKKFLALTLKIVGKIFEIKKGIPPTNL